ncbi:hypothetical protein ABK040_000888 [Willaertia magna]
MSKGNNSTPTSPSASKNNSEIPLRDMRDVVVLKKPVNNNSSIVSSSDRGRDICDATTCLEIIEHDPENQNGDDTTSSCKVCVAKQASTAVLVFEAIPLSIKLIFIVFFAILSLAAFGAILISKSARTLSTSKYIQTVSTVSLIFSDLIQEIQGERSQSIMYSTPGSSYAGLEAQINKTNAVIEKYVEAKISWDSDIKGKEGDKVEDDKSSSDNSGDEGQSPNGQFLFEGAAGYNYLMDYYITNLPNHRLKVKDRIYSTTLPIMQYYVDWINNIIGGVTVMSVESDDPSFKIIHASYSQIMTLKELLNLKRSILIYFMMQGVIKKDIYDYLQYINSKYSIIYDQFDITTSADAKEKYVELIDSNVQLEKLLSQFESYIIANPNMAQLNFTINDIYYNYSTKINNMRTVENFLRNNTLFVASQLHSQAIGELIAYTISTVFVIFLSIIIAVFFSRTIVVPWKRLLRSQKDRTKELATSYTQLNLLLERISAEEQKTRKILNSMEDALVTTNNQGYIMHCNDTFYKMFQFTESDVYGGVMKLRIQQIIPNLELTEIFQQFNTLDTVITPDKELKAITKVGTDFPVRVSLNFCRLYLNDLTSKEDDTNSNTIVLSTEKLVQQEQACIILIHNLSEKMNPMEREKESQEIVEFRAMFNNPLKKLEFKEYCKRFKTDENISFLEEVQNYKNLTSLQERAQKQKEIFNLYLKADAKKLLNISKEQLAINNFRINKYLGEIELFDSLERIVIENVVHDIYKRWKEHEKQEMDSFI